MAITSNARLLVNRPGAMVPRYGLFNVANGPLDLPVHARVGGLEYESPVCVLPTGYDISCPGSEGEPKEFNSGGASVITANPFVVRSDLLCAPVGLTNTQLRQWLLERLRAGEQATVEWIFSQGLFGALPALANSGNPATDLGASATLTDAVAALESWLYAQYGLPGVLHVPLGTAAAMAAADLAFWDGRVWRTALGTLVSFGNYAGLAPNGADPADGDAYLYITGQVTVWRASDSDVFTTPLAAGLDRTTNQVYGQAEREYVVAYECFAAGVSAPSFTAPTPPVEP